METIRGLFALLYLGGISYGALEVWRAEGIGAALVFFLLVNLFAGIVMALSDTANAIINRILGK